MYKINSISITLISRCSITTLVGSEPLSKQTINDYIVYLAFNNIR